MCPERLTASRLYALIGDSARLLPDNAAASLEVMLGLQEKQQEKLAAATERLNAASRRSATDAINAASLGWQEREAVGTVLEILHASQQADGEGFGGELNDRLIEGLLIAGRLIVQPCRHYAWPQPQDYSGANSNRVHTP